MFVYVKILSHLIQKQNCLNQKIYSEYSDGDERKKINDRNLNLIVTKIMPQKVYYKLVICSSYVKKENDQKIYCYHHVAPRTSKVKINRIKLIYF